MDTLVSTDWLSQHLDDPGLVILDCSVRTDTHVAGSYRNISGRADYDSGHIPGAGFADLMTELCDTGKAIEFALPTPKRFCTAMGKLGVGDDSTVILYDNSFSAWAARVWWMLRWVGFDRAALLNGGLKAWTSAGRPLSTAPPTYPRRKLTLNLRPRLIADRDEVRASIDDDTVCIMDTMPEAHYRGDMSMYARPGHIPGAINRFGLALLDGSGCYRPDNELRALFDTDPDARTITYCGGGIMASSTAFILHRLGYKDVAVYTASLQEWAADPANPLVVAEAETV